MVKKVPNKKKAAPKAKAVKAVKVKAQEYTYVTLHWLAFNGRTGEMVGMFARNKGEVLSLINVMRQAISRLETSGNKIANLTIKSFIEVPKHIAELYLKEKDAYEAERNEVMQKFVADQQAAQDKAKAEHEAMQKFVADQQAAQDKAKAEHEAMKNKAPELSVVPETEHGSDVPESQESLPLSEVDSLDEVDSLGEESSAQEDDL